MQSHPLPIPCFIILLLVLIDSSAPLRSARCCGISLNSILRFLLSLVRARTSTLALTLTLTSTSTSTCIRIMTMTMTIRLWRPLHTPLLLLLRFLSLLLLLRHRNGGHLLLKLQIRAQVRQEAIDAAPGLGPELLLRRIFTRRYQVPAAGHEEQDVLEVLWYGFLLW